MVLFLICLGTVKQDTGSLYSLKVWYNRTITIKVTNFMDFAAKKLWPRAVFQRTSNLSHTKTPLSIEIVEAMLFLRECSYGKNNENLKFLKEEDGHSPKAPVMRRTGLDVDYYYKNIYLQLAWQKIGVQVLNIKAKTYK